MDDTAFADLEAVDEVLALRLRTLLQAGLRVWQIKHYGLEDSRAAEDAVSS
jgi:hypothetical protein